MRCVKIGTRGSALALWQTDWVKSKLGNIFPDCKFEVIRIQTRGDRVFDVPLETIGGEGVFVKQIEIALLDGEIDLAVHSMKDLPTVLPDGLIIGAIPERADPADVLISERDEQRAESKEQRAKSREQRAKSKEQRAESKELRAKSGEQRAKSGEQRAESKEQRAESKELRARSSKLYALCPMLYHLPEGAKIGTSSLRRRAQLLHARDDLTIRDIRGNVGTRLAKLRSGDLDAIVLALAGVERLGYGDLMTQRLPYDICLPAVGQGAIGVEMRAEDKELRDMVKGIDHLESAAAVRAERAFLRSLGGGCRVPIAALGTVDSGELNLVGLVAQRDGRRVMRSGTSGRQEEAEDIGKRLAELLLDMGARSILDSGF